MTLTFEAFMEMFKDLWDFPYKSTNRFDKDYMKRDESKARVSVEWTTGGATGGNCFNDDPPESDRVEAEAEPELEGLDQILEKVAPAITYLQYKKVAKLFQVADHTQHEYYGNYYDKREKWVDARQLYDILVELGYIQ